MGVAGQPQAIDRRAAGWGLAGVAVVAALTYVGSDGLIWFDAALVGYLFGVALAVFAVIYRYSVWLRRPPTAMLNRRGWETFRAGVGPGSLAVSLRPPRHTSSAVLVYVAVLSGPPSRPLGRIDVEVRDDGQVWALGASP